MEEIELHRDNTWTLKFLFIGEDNAGKDSLCKKLYTDGSIKERQFEYYKEQQKDCWKIKQKVFIKKMNNVTTKDIKDFNCIAFVFDSTEDLKKVNDCVDKLVELTYEEREIPVFLIANKIDLCESKIKEKIKEGNLFLYPSDNIILASSKTNEGIDWLYNTMIEEGLKNAKLRHLDWKSYYQARECKYKEEKEQEEFKRLISILPEEEKQRRKKETNEARSQIEKLNIKNKKYSELYPIEDMMQMVIDIGVIGEEKVGKSALIKTLEQMNNNKKILFQYTEYTIKKDSTIDNYNKFEGYFFIFDYSNPKSIQENINLLRIIKESNKFIQIIANKGDFAENNKELDELLDKLYNELKIGEKCLIINLSTSEQSDLKYHLKDLLYTVNNYLFNDPKKKNELIKKSLMPKVRQITRTQIEEYHKYFINTFNQMKKNYQTLNAIIDYYDKQIEIMKQNNEEHNQVKYFISLKEYYLEERDKLKHKIIEQYDNIEEYKKKIVKNEKMSKPINNILKIVNLITKGNEKNIKDYLLPRWYQQCQMDFNEPKKEEEYKKIIKEIKEKQ